MVRLTIDILPGRWAVCRLDRDAAIPDWPRGAFVSITRTPDELSILCDEAAVPEGVRAERGWRCLKVEGPIPFETTGIAAALTAPLAASGISLFIVSTFDTDYLLLKDDALDRAMAVLRSSGIVVH